MLVVAVLVLAAAVPQAVPAAAPAQAASGASPIGRVVELLSNLKAKIVADGHTEQTLYDKYACWCDETSARKASAIEEGKASVEALSQNILELSAAQGASGATLKKLAKDIAANQASAKEADALRAKEHKSYIQEKGELEENMGALEKAITVLAKGTTGFTPAMVATQSLTIVAGVRDALKLFEKDPENKDKDLNPVRHFIADPAAWVQSKSSTTYVGNVKSYDHQSGAIQGMLQEMYDSFQRDLGTSKEEEDQKQADFEGMKQTKLTELGLLQTSLTKQSSKNGEDAKSLQDDKVGREEAEAQLRADEDFFFTMKQGCKAKAAEWADRSKVRTEELKGIAEAVDILSGGQEVFDRADATLLQLTAIKKVRGPRDWAFSALKKVAKADKSIQLATLATKVYLAERGHFDAVIGEIDAMINVLRSEEKDDIEHRDYCQTEKNNAAAKTEMLQYDMEELANKVARLENKVTNAEADKQKVESEQSQLKVTMKEALEQRNEENAAFRQAMADDLESISLIKQAMAALAPKYGALVVVDAKVGAKATDAPADSPPETFGKSYGGRKSEGGGIMMILNMIAEDLEKDITNAKKDENGNLAEYEKLRTENNASNDAMDAKKSALEQHLADLNEEIAITTGAKLQKETLEGETGDYVTDLAKGCDGILAQFESRAGQRKDELNGLENAKNILRGAGYDETKDQPTAKLVAVKAQTSASVGSYAASVDAQLRDLDNDAFGFAAQSFLQRRH